MSLINCGLASVQKHHKFIIKYDEQKMLYQSWTTMHHVCYQKRSMRAKAANIWGGSCSLAVQPILLHQIKLITVRTLNSHADFILA